MTDNPVHAAAEFEPFSKRCRAPMDRPVGGYPQGLASGTLRRRAKCSKIGDLPGDEPHVQSERPVQALGQPVCARRAEGTVAVIDKPRHFTSHPALPLSAAHFGAETYVHVGFSRSAQVAT